MANQYTIRIDGGAEFACEDGDTFLRAALRAGIGFPYECNSGGCSTCRMEVLSGDFDILWEDAPGRTARDRKKDRYLGCQTAPASNCVIKFREDPETVPQVKPARGEFEFVQKIELTPDMCEFVFSAENPAEFLPGQFAQLYFPGIVGARSYSMSNLGNSDGEWRFIVKALPGGAGSDYLFKTLEVGMVLPFDGPYGLAYLREDRPRDIVCVGG
ncbi:MAG: 2Fe-2S iron-sulfur cluster-binding protein, partial [Pseudomonadota bacterium]